MAPVMASTGAMSMGRSSRPGPVATLETRQRRRARQRRRCVHDGPRGVARRARHQRGAGTSATTPLCRRTKWKGEATDVGGPVEAALAAVDPV
uniref:Uncharacterized protein n=1 Tax=Arundo donax TaxID=35708 RepID=A0A0A9HV42_ARUDO